MLRHAGLRDIAGEVDGQAKACPTGPSWLEAAGPDRAGHAPPLRADAGENAGTTADAAGMSACATN